MALSSGHDGFGARLAADDRGERTCRGSLSGAHLLLMVESGPRCGGLSKAFDGSLGVVEAQSPMVLAAGSRGGIFFEIAPSGNSHRLNGPAI